MTSPYRDAALTYLQQGWKGILPLPKNSKASPPTGTTGYHAEDPDINQIIDWMKNSDGNIALRLPDTVIGIDVDSYPGKHGGDTYQMLELELGYLPPTWRSTSRDDITSSIRYYRIPAGLQWPSIFGIDIEAIRRQHRYAVVPPSIHPNGNQYRWYNPNGIETDTPPTPDELPQLPQRWIDHFTGGRAEKTPLAKTLTSDQTRELLADIATAGEPCRQVRNTLEELYSVLDGDKGSRHDLSLHITKELVRLGAEGHQGVQWAILHGKEIYTSIIGLDRGHNTAADEYDRMISGAAALNPTKTTTICLGDQCDPYQLPHTPEPATTPFEPTADIDAEKTTWTPIDLQPIYNGDTQPEEPEIMERQDGQCLLYPGKVHSIYGEPESGKSIIMQQLAAVLIQTGEHVLYIDCESDEHTTTDRLRRFGCTSDHLKHFTYIRPERSWRATPAEHEAWTTLLAQPYALAIIDGVTEALSLFGYETNDNDGITRFMRLVPRAIARSTGAATVLIDHVTKNNKSRFAIGGQAKLAAIDGAAYLLDVKEPPAIGIEGTLVLRITKDRPGRIRGHCWTDTDSADRTQIAAIIRIDSRDKDRTIVITEPPFNSEGGGKFQTKKTTLKEKICEAFITCGEYDLHSQNTILNNVKGNTAQKRQAWKELIASGHIKEIGTRFKLSKHFSELELPTSTMGEK